MINIPAPLWKACRILANETRLQLIWTLFTHGELCVTQLVELTNISRTNASNQLRLLAEHGLVVSRREKMSVIYRAESNAAMEFAPPMLAALENGFAHSMSFQTIIRQATALSHSRRIEIIQALKGKSRSFEEIKDATGMSPAALSRHLLKLEKRNFIMRTGNFYRYGKPGNTLGKVLIKLGGNTQTTATHRP
jgi:DNA-binding transcriptional ArsR family regulator